MWSSVVVLGYVVSVVVRLRLVVDLWGVWVAFGLSNLFVVRWRIWVVEIGAPFWVVECLVMVDWGCGGVIMGGCGLNWLGVVYGLRAGSVGALCGWLILGILNSSVNLGVDLSVVDIVFVLICCGVFHLRSCLLGNVLVSRVRGVWLFLHSWCIS